MVLGHSSQRNFRPETYLATLCCTQSDLGLMDTIVLSSVLAGMYDINAHGIPLTCRRKKGLRPRPGYCTMTIYNTWSHRGTTLERSPRYTISG